jgi:hypothetical protein
MTRLTLCLLLLATPATAQTTCPAPGPCTVTVGQAYAVAADITPWTAVNAPAGFRFYINGVKTGADLTLSALSAGVVTVAGLVAPARGSYTLEMTAFNADGESPKSAPALTLVSKLATPPTPGNVRIILAVSLIDGQLRFEFRGIETIE